jgi:DNA-directed RNA polymerase subunit RPC12/RpoP
MGAAARSIGGRAVSPEFSPSTPGAGERIDCPKCGTKMLLTRIEPDKADHDKRTFECPKCQHVETVIIKYR